MFTIRFVTSSYRPPRVVSLRVWKHGGSGRYIRGDQGGEFLGDAWAFCLKEEEYPHGLKVEFMLDGTWKMDGAATAKRMCDGTWTIEHGALDVTPQAGAVYTSDNAYIGFQVERLTDIPVDDGVVERRLFKPVYDDRHWDVIVIGSGMGGGIVAERLEDLFRTSFDPNAQPKVEPKRVLILEAGGYLFPTHVGNLPRQHSVGRFSKHVWHLWDEFEVRNYSNAPGSEFSGGEGLYLGGRSIFWGGLIPRMNAWELELWPDSVVRELSQKWYACAETLMRKEVALETAFVKDVKEKLANALPDFDVEGAPVAVQTKTAGGSGIGAGMFSTADLLMESILTATQEESDKKPRHLFLNLHHRVECIKSDGKVVKVVATDLLADEERTFVADNVILAAGTLETPMILARSGMVGENSPIGQGITDHQSHYMHFAIPKVALQPDGDGRPGGPQIAKLLAYPKHGDGEEKLPFNIIIEIGSDFNQGRYIDDDILQQHEQQLRDHILCEVVFLFDTSLDGCNSVKPGDDRKQRAQVTMRPGTMNDELRTAMEAIKDIIIKTLNGRSIPSPQPGNDDEFYLHPARPGAAGHETGTLRMRRRNESNEPGWVVDENLKLRDSENVYVCDLSVFPTSPAANPSLTLAALALRLADTLASKPKPET